jgi:hypothetical protein
MHRRALHIASLFLLLASMGTAEAATLHNGAPAFAAPYIRVLLAQQQAAVAAQTALAAVPTQHPALDLPAAAQEQHSIVWTTRAPIAQTIAVHATSSSL